MKLHYMTGRQLGASSADLRAAAVAALLCAMLDGRLAPMPRATWNTATSNCAHRTGRPPRTETASHVGRGRVGLMKPPEAADDAPMGTSGGALDATEYPIDVLIVVALEDELDAVLAEGGGAEAWQKLRDHVHVRRMPNERGGLLGVAAAWTGAMGATATATRAAPLVEKLQPACIAMCGICAGKRGEVALGDVIVADRVYSSDHGKLKAPQDGAPGALFHEIETYNLERSWKLDAAAFRRDLGWAEHLLPSRPPQKTTQERWLLNAIYANEHEGGPAPLSHPERAAVFRTAVEGTTDWADRIRELRKKGLLAAESGVLKLTEAGRGVVDEDRLLYPEGPPRDPPFQVHVGPIATGNAVIEDPDIFDRLKRVQRKTLGVEMEAYAIGYIGDGQPRRAIIAKAVSDHADHDKDDRFRTFACRASAAWLLAFLQRHLAPRPPEEAEPAGPSDLIPRSPFPDLPRGGASSRGQGADGITEERPAVRSPRSGDELYGADDLLRRIERALIVRHPNARISWKRGPHDGPAFVRVFLEVQPPGGGYTKAYPVAVVGGTVDRSAIDGFVEHVVSRYRAYYPYIEPLLVHTEATHAEAGTRAREHGVRMESFIELQGLLDFRPYVAEQTRQLERDPVYPSKLYVPQRLEYRVGFEEHAKDDALETLYTLLGREGPQLALVLGDFGTGKTFLMRELALRLGRQPGAIVPGPRRAAEAREGPQPRCAARTALHPRARHERVQPPRVPLHARGGSRRAPVRRLRRAGAAGHLRGRGRAPRDRPAGGDR